MLEEKYFLKNEQYIFEKFEFKSSLIFEDVIVDYGTMGTPKFDDEGNIVNALLFCHGFFKDYANIHDFNQIFGRDKLFNQDDYFIISITSLGIANSFSPSTSELNNDFPNYMIEDLVNFQRQFLNERFPEIKKIKGIFGYSFGGYIALGWSIYYPEDMEFVIHFASSFKGSAYKYIFSKFANRIIEASSYFQQEVYNPSMAKGLILLSQLHYLMSFSSDYVYSLSNEEIDFSLESFADESLFLDIHNIKFINDFMMTFDLSDQLDKIKCRLLVIGVENNAYSVPKYDSIPIYEAVAGSEFLLLDASNKNNEADSLYKIEDEIRNFVESI